MKDWKLTRNFSILVPVPGSEFIAFFRTRVESRKEFLAKKIKTPFEGDIDEEEFSIQKKWTVFVTDNSNHFLVKGGWEDLGNQTQLNCHVEIKPYPQIAFILVCIVIFLIGLGLSQNFLIAILSPFPLFLVYYAHLYWLDDAKVRFEKELIGLFRKS